MYIAFLALLVIYIAVSSIRGALKKKKPEDAYDTEKAKCKKYVKMIARYLGMALAIFIMSFIGGISLAELGFRPFSFNHNIWFTAATLVASGLVSVYFIRLLILSLASKKFKEKQAINPSAEQFLPRTAKERKLYSLVAFSSAMSEEIMFRGFAVFLLQAVFPDIPIFLIILITGAVFGLAHLYQGLAGVIETGVAGILFMALFLASGSLILPVLLHFAADFSVTFLRSKEQAA